MENKSVESEHKLSHVDPQGRAKMVDVGAKQATQRQASAKAIVKLGRLAAAAVRSNEIAKGDVLAVARIAGISAAKRTDELIPLCHSLPLDSLEVEFGWNANDLHITAIARVTAKTGVEMEALTACSVAALTVYDMCKAVDKSIEIKTIHLVAKSGGKSGDYRRFET